ncbi:MAG: barstar family protein [Pseudomonadota bacterium]
MKQYTLDGSAFQTLEEFAAHFSDVVLGEHRWNGNLDALNDILRGGFGTPQAGFEIVWENASLSREALGYAETVRQLEKRLSTCHPKNASSVEVQIQKARSCTGPTVFDWIFEIIREHGKGGSESDDGVVLSLR